MPLRGTPVWSPPSPFASCSSINDRAFPLRDDPQILVNRCISPFILDTSTTRRSTRALRFSCSFSSESAFANARTPRFPIPDKPIFSTQYEHSLHARSRAFGVEDPSITATHTNGPRRLLARSSSALICSIRSKNVSLNLPWKDNK